MKKRIWLILIAITGLGLAGAVYYRDYQRREGSEAVLTTLKEPDQGKSDKADMQKQTQTFGEGKSSAVASKAAAELAGMKQELTEDQESDDSKRADRVDMVNMGIYVHLCGAVRKPAVYRVEAGSRLVDVIALAEGLTEDAAGDYINQAMTLEDGQRIYVPTKEEVEELGYDRLVMTETAGRKEDSKPKLININRADADELMKLPGIGAAKAENIIAYREANGDFTAVEELMQVPGIKEGLYGQLAAYITVK